MESRSLPIARGEGEDWLHRDTREFCREMNMFCVTLLVVVQLFTLATTEQIIHTKLVNFISCKLHLDKIVKRIDHRPKNKKSNLYHI